MINTIILGHALNVLPKLLSKSVNCVVTSPPYWNLRDYGIEPVIWDEDKNCKHEWGNKTITLKHKSGETNPGIESWFKDRGASDDKGNCFCIKCGAWRGSLGLEPTFELYIKHLCDIFDEVKRVLRKDGTCWVNIGDSYWGSGQGGADYGGKEIIPSSNFGHIAKGKNYPNKSLCDIPYRFSIEMINRGWIKRNTLIWWKPNCMPSSAPDRFTVDFEYLFFFVKNNKTLFWTNEKTLECVEKKPLGIKGIEGKDWEWRKCPTCQGKGEIIGNALKDGNSPIDIGTGIIDKNTKAFKICPRCKGSGKIKYSFWTGHDYWFEQQFEEYAPDTLPRMDRGVNVNKWTFGANGQTPHNLSQPRLNKKRGYKTKQPDKGTQHPQYHGKDINYGKQGRNKRCVWKIPTKSFKEAHFACVDSETEILTIKGWKKYTDIKWYKSSPHHILIATYNLEKQIIEYQPLSYIKEYDCKELIKVGNRDLDILMTSNHRNIVKKKTGEEKIVIAENLAYSDKIRVFAPVIYPENIGIGETFSELIGWIITEGHFKKGGHIEIYQNEGDKAKRIDYLLNKLEIPYTRNVRRDNQVFWYLKKSPLVEWCLINIPKKKLNQFLISLPIKEAVALFNSLIAGDGHIRKDDGRLSFIQKDKETKDWFQILALRVGYHSIQEGKTVYLTKRTHIGIRKTNGKDKNIGTIKYEGKVWCPKTKNGTWIARRNGRIFITGNTFPETLIEPIIKAGCPEFVCKKCGKARIKILEPTEEYKEYLGKGNLEEHHAGQETKTKFKVKANAEYKFRGYSDCGCGAGWESGINLDPFMGTGTTALVALKQRKRFIGIEIKQEYIDMSYKRIAKVQQKIF